MDPVCMAIAMCAFECTWCMRFVMLGVNIIAIVHHLPHCCIGVLILSFMHAYADTLWIVWRLARGPVMLTITPLLGDPYVQVELVTPNSCDMY